MSTSQAIQDLSWLPVVLPCGRKIGGLKPHYVRPLERLLALLGFRYFLEIRIATNELRSTAWRHPPSKLRSVWNSRVRVSPAQSERSLEQRSKIRVDTTKAPECCKSSLQPGRCPQS